MWVGGKVRQGELRGVNAHFWIHLVGLGKMKLGGWGLVPTLEERVKGLWLEVLILSPYPHLSLPLSLFAT